MGTQWVVGSTEAGHDDFGSRSAYQPRHAKSRRDQLPTGCRGDQMHTLAAGEGLAGQFGVPGYRGEDYAPMPIRRGLRSRAATFVRTRSRR
jgi:hypothetical protein